MDLWSAQSRRASICRRIAFITETATLAVDDTSCTADPLQPTRSGQTSMLPGTLTQLCWRELAWHRVVTSICVVPLRSYRACATGCGTGVCSPKMCTRKSSVLSRLLPLVWRRLFTLLTCHKGRPDLALQSHSRVAGLPPLGIRNSRVCLNWRKRATFRSDGRAGLESVIPA